MRKMQEGSFWSKRPQSINFKINVINQELDEKHKMLLEKNDLIEAF